MNKVILIGHLTKDVELKTTPTGLSVASFSIATNKSVKKNDQWEKVAQFHNLVAWRHTAEALAKYNKKGSKVAVFGELQTRSYDDKQGVKRYVTEVVVNEVEFMNQANQSNNNQEYSQPAPQDNYSQPENNEEDEIKVENIPF